MKVILISLMALLSAFTLADTYKWTDENGKVHFGDKPMNDSAIKISSSKDIPLNKSKDESTNKNSNKATQKTTTMEPKSSYPCSKTVLIENDSQARVRYKCLEH